MFSVYSQASVIERMLLAGHSDAQTFRKTHGAGTCFAPELRFPAWTVHWGRVYELSPS
jgi:hypothetical protein